MTDRSAEPTEISEETRVCFLLHRDWFQCDLRHTQSRISPQAFLVFVELTATFTSKDVGVTRSSTWFSSQT